MVDMQTVVDLTGGEGFPAHRGVIDLRGGGVSSAAAAR